MSQNRAETLYGRMVALFMSWFGVSMVAILISPFRPDFAAIAITAANVFLAIGALSILIWERKDKRESKA